MAHPIASQFNQAQRLQQLGELNAAIALYETILATEPTHFEARRHLGLSYAELGDMDNAIRHLTQAIELHPDDHTLHNNLANAYKRLKKLDQAITHYQRAIELQPDYAQGHNNLATVFALQNQYQLALTHYRLAVHAAPDFTAAHFNLGLLLLKHHQPDAAAVQFKNVLALQPNHLEARFYLGIFHLESHLLDTAEADFNAVLAIDNTYIDAVINLGVLALKRDQGQVAVDYFTKALLIDEANRDARNNLAATFLHYDRYDNALTHYEILLKDDPNQVEYLYNAGVAQMALGYLEEAKARFQSILTQQPTHFAALTNLAAIESKLGERDKAIYLLKRAQSVNPEDPSCQFMLNALTGDNTQPDACPSYITNLFNQYALYYDKHMQETLHYSIPIHIERVLNKLQGNHRVAQAIDLGCGTGLCGPIIKKISDHVTGVDLSAKMLKRAREKHVYDELVESDLISFLQQNASTYELAVAADVLPYFGALEPLFTLIQERLSSKGLFIFSTEIALDGTWHLQSTGRFSHHPEYVTSVCNQLGLSLIHQEECTARIQDHNPLTVMIYAVTKLSNSH